jgi:ribosome-associated protein
MLAPLMIRPDVVVPSGAMSMTAVRSAGPGGQNVNKVASKVDLRVDLRAIRGLSPDARARLSALVATRLDADGYLQLTSQRTRDQAKNLADAMDKLRVLIERALVAPVPRRATRPTRGSVERRLTEKHHAAKRKASRRLDSE